MRNLIAIFLVALIAVSALALSGYLKVFSKTYEIKKGSVLDKAKCLVCHTDKAGKKVNRYGADLQKALRAAGTKTLSEKILSQVENLDSDGDGVKNLEEIKADTLPGDPKSK